MSDAVFVVQLLMMGSDWVDYMQDTNRADCEFHADKRIEHDRLEHLPRRTVKRIDEVVL